MPLYEYQCDACGQRFERIQKFSDALVTVCPACGGPVHKLISSPAIQFKGSGFYITDYAKSGRSESEKADKKAESAGKSDTVAGGDSKAQPSDQAAKSDKAGSTPSSTTPAQNSSGDSGSGGTTSTPASTKDSSNPPAKN